MEQTAAVASLEDNIKTMYRRHESCRVVSSRLMQTATFRILFCLSCLDLSNLHKMTNSHNAVAIAQVIFYAPMVPIALFIFVRNWNNRPRMAWYALIPFSLRESPRYIVSIAVANSFGEVRFAGGIVTAILESNPNNMGLNIAATIMLNVGLVPLIIAAVGIIRLM